MELNILDETNSIANHFISEMRNIDIQSDRLRFRENMKRLGNIMAYEFSKTLNYDAQVIKTPLGSSTIQIPVNKLYLMTVLRAGLPFYNGFLEIFDQIDSGFIGAYRAEESSSSNAGSPEINLDYIASDSLNDKEVLLVDPMLATGNSLVAAYKSILQTAGKPAKIHFFSIIGTEVGIDQLKNNIDIPMSIWVGSVDEKLNDKAYIIPGLGDAGDLSFGTKI
ncbi:MAG: uracil phosphoribosyltransferase [Bacteroidota bacterium]